MHYFCTAGRGTEMFASKELQKTLQITHEEIEITDGKVFFKCSVDDSSKLYQLKTVERVFAQIVHLQKKQLKENLNTYNGIKKTIVDSVDWYNKELLHVIELLRNGSKKTIEEDSDGEPPAKKHCNDDNKETRFRISCKCAGKAGRQIQSQNLSRQIGVALSKCLNWKIDLKSPHIEVNIHLNDERLIVGIPLKRTPLSNRSYIKHFGLRSTVAWIIADVVNPKNGDLVLDPMCGKGTILLELARNNMNLHCVGIDKDRQQLKYAEENIKFADLSGCIELIQADSNSTLIKDGNVDKVVCDAPFGKKFHLEQETKIFYTQLFKHVDRVLRPDGQFVLLTSSEIFKCIERYKHNDKQLPKPTVSKTNTNTEQCDLNVNTNSPILPVNEKEMFFYDGPDKKFSLSETSDESFSNDVLALSETLKSGKKSRKSCCMTYSAYNRQGDRCDTKLKLKTGRSEVNVDSRGIINKKEEVTCDLEEEEVSCDQKVEKLNKDKYWCKNKYNNSTQAKPKDNNQSEQSQLNHGSLPKGALQHEIDCYNLILTEHHYIKLGETDSYICVFNKIH